MFSRCNLLPRRAARLRAAAARPRRVSPGPGASLGRSSLRCDSPALLGFAAHRVTHFARLCALRSNRRDESVDEARCARGRKPCATRRPRGAPSPGPTRLGKGSGGGAPVSGALVQSDTIGVPLWACHLLYRLALGGVGWGRSLWRREAQGRGRHAQRASSSCSPQLSERREQRERSEFCGAPPARASQRSGRAASTATV